MFSLRASAYQTDLIWRDLTWPDPNRFSVNATRLESERIRTSEVRLKNFASVHEFIARRPFTVVSAKQSVILAIAISFIHQTVFCRWRIKDLQRTMGVRVVHLFVISPQYYM